MAMPARCPDQLSVEDFQSYFATLIDSRSWSLVKIDRCGLQFFYEHVLQRPWPWVGMIKPPVVHALPDVLTLDEVARLVKQTREAIRPSGGRLTASACAWVRR